MEITRKVKREKLLKKLAEIDKEEEAEVKKE
jgi:hypothetical protein